MKLTGHHVTEAWQYHHYHPHPKSGLNVFIWVGHPASMIITVCHQTFPQKMTVEHMKAFIKPLFNEYDAQQSTCSNIHKYRTIETWLREQLWPWRQRWLRSIQFEALSGPQTPDKHCTWEEDLWFLPRNIFLKIKGFIKGHILDLVARAALAVAAAVAP